MMASQACAASQLAMNPLSGILCLESIDHIAYEGSWDRMQGSLHNVQSWCTCHRSFTGMVKKKKIELEKQSVGLESGARHQAVVQCQGQA